MPRKDQTGPGGQGPKKTNRGIPKRDGSGGGQNKLRGNKRGAGKNRFGGNR